MRTDFWKLTAANFLIITAMYMIIPLLPLILLQGFGLSTLLAAAATSITGVAVFLLGPFCSYAIQRFRRNVVCISSIAITSIAFLAASCCIDEMQANGISKEYAMALIATRIVSGAFFGLSIIILNSTLIIDSCESSKRTQANAISAWVHILAIPTGMAIGTITQTESNPQDVFYAASATSAVAILLMISTRFPFKAPEETISTFSFDRFIATSCLTFSIPAILTAIILGMTIAKITSAQQFAYLAIGSISAISCLVWPNNNRGKKSTKFKVSKKGIDISAISGYTLLLVSAITTTDIATPHSNSYIAQAGIICTGAATTLIFSNIHLCFIESADHCQRGSAESTYLLTLELGIAAGIAIHILFFSQSANKAISNAMPHAILPTLLAIVSVATYLIFIRRNTKLLFN